MKISNADQRRYPVFTEYVKNAIPALISNRLIVSNVLTYGGLTYAEFRNAIAWGGLPNLVITDLHHGQCGVPRAYGCFRFARPVNLEIHTGVVTDFEGSSTTDNNASGKAVYVLGATLLHELCHWGNHNNIPRIPEIKEMGAEFEKATYGKILY